MANSKRRVLFVLSLFFIGIVPAFANANENEAEIYLKLAEGHFAEGEYNATRDLTEEVLKRYPGHAPSRALLEKSKVQLQRLAHESYIHGAMLESMNLVSQARQYWNRTLNYVRPGDPYYDWTTERLSHYQ